MKEGRIGASEITPENVYLNRRAIMKAMGGTVGLLAAGSIGLPASALGAGGMKPLEFQPNPRFSTNEKMTPYEAATRYNNFYEFGTDKSDPAKNATRFRVHPWSVTIEGEAGKTGTFHLEDILKPHPLEERIYRLRCVEAWSMVIPWLGFPLADLLKRFEPTSRARFVEFTTLYDPEQMPGQRSSFSTIEWPYVEGLRMDEAMHPLTLMAVGMYGKTLPPQNGAPLRLVVPWKYGFKSIKSIVRIRFTETMPKTTWARIAPDEYGFYANVNPQVDHPRWSQKTERRLPSSFFSPNRIETRLFNGYAEEVASLYAGMDLRKFF